LNPNISNNNCPTCCANRREDRRIVDEGDDGDTYCDDPWHGNAPPTPAPADDAGGAKSPFPAPERAAFPSLYCAIYPGLIPVARSLGYALAIHGSVSRDLDLIAVPWTENARPPEELVEAIRATFDGWIGGATNGHPFGEKPHGRRAWSIMLGGHAVVDLSVVPIVGAPRERDPVREAVVEAVRETCARVAETICDDAGDPEGFKRRIAAAIRARREAPTETPR